MCSLIRGGLLATGMCAGALTTLLAGPAQAVPDRPGTTRDAVVREGGAEHRGGWAADDSDDSSTTLSAIAIGSALVSVAAFARHVQVRRRLSSAAERPTSVPHQASSPPTPHAVRHPVSRTADPADAPAGAPLTPPPWHGQSEPSPSPEPQDHNAIDSVWSISVVLADELGDKVSRSDAEPPTGDHEAVDITQGFEAAPGPDSHRSLSPSWRPLGDGGAPAP